MNIINSIKIKHPNLFEYLKADEIHPHDHFMARTFLRLFPKKVTPNEITMFRIIATPVVFYLVLKGYYIWGIISFLLVAFTDAIDGSMARTQHRVTRFGMMFDPMADKLLIGSMVLILVFKYFNFWLGLSILCLEIAFILSALISTYKFKNVLMANLWGKIKMILQVLAVFATLLALLLEMPYLLTIASWIFGLAVGFAVVSLFAHGI